MAGHEQSAMQARSPIHLASCAWAAERLLRALLQSPIMHSSLQGERAGVWDAALCVRASAAARWSGGGDDAGRIGGFGDLAFRLEGAARQSGWALGLR
jgi:hypothetical protein